MKKALLVLFIAVWSMSVQGCMMMQVTTRADAPAKPHHNHDADNKNSDRR